MVTKISEDTLRKIASNWIADVDRATIREMASECVAWRMANQRQVGSEAKSPQDDVDVPLNSDDLDLIDDALCYVRDRWDNAKADAISELLDRLNRSRLLP